MNQYDILLELFKYFAKFVPLDVRKKQFKNGKQPGYAEIKADILALPDTFVIPDISAYVISANEEFVLEKVKNSSGVVLYVEYGAVSYNPTIANGISETLALHVAMPYNMKNSDNLNETLLMNKTLNILSQILDQMKQDQLQHDFCGTRELISFPADIVPINSKLFSDRSGWMAIFDHITTAEQ